MIRRIVVPKLSANVDEVVLTAWLKQPGDRVKRGEPIVELTTDKAAFDLECPYSGIVRAQLSPVKSTLPIGYILALVGGAEDPLPDMDAVNRKLLEKYKRRPSRKRSKRGAKAENRIRVRATPSARRLAREQGVDLAEIQKQTGAERITETILREHLSL